MAHKINFDALPKDNPAGEQALVGHHAAKIVTATMGKSKNKGTAQMEVVFELTHTSGKKCKFKDTFYLTDNVYTQYKLGRFLAVAGLAVPGGESDLDLLVKVMPGKEMCLLINLNTKENPPKAQVDFFNEGYLALEEFAKQVALANPEATAEAPLDPTVPFV